MMFIRHHHAYFRPLRLTWDNVNRFRSVRRSNHMFRKGILVCAYPVEWNEIQKPTLLGSGRFNLGSNLLLHVIFNLQCQRFNLMKLLWQCIYVSWDCLWHCSRSEEKIMNSSRHNLIILSNTFLLFNIIKQKFLSGGFFRGTAKRVQVQTSVIPPSSPSAAIYGLSFFSRALQFTSTD